MSTLLLIVVIAIGAFGLVSLAEAERRRAEQQRERRLS